VRISVAWRTGPGEMLSFDWVSTNESRLSLPRISLPFGDLVWLNDCSIM
jgi:hypothetical protein